MMEKNSYPTHWIKCGPKTPLIIWCLCRSLLELCFFSIKCSSMMRKSRRAVWIWCCVDCLRNFLWDYLQLFPCLPYLYLDLQYIRISSDLPLHVVVGSEVFNVWFYFLFSCSDEVASNYVWTYENCLWFYMQPSEPIICFPAFCVFFVFFWPANLHFFTSAKHIFFVHFIL